MSGHSLKNIYKNGGFQQPDTWNLVNENHLCSRKNGCASGSKFRKGDATALDELIIHNMLIPSPFFLETVNNFNESPPFGLYDIFNNLICSPELITGSTLRFKRALPTAYSSFDSPVLTIKCQNGFCHWSFKANFTAPLFVCFSFARCVLFTIESRRLLMVYIFIPKTKQRFKEWLN